MIAPSVMNLTALPAPADNSIRMIDSGAHAIVVDRSEPRSAEEALEARHLELAAILMRQPDHAGRAVDQRLVSAQTGGHIAYLDRAAAATPIRGRRDTLRRTWKNEFR
jgi:hypothetical protein